MATWTQYAWRLVLLAVLGAPAGCNAIVPFEDCATDRDCPTGLRCSPARHICHAEVVEQCGNGRDDDLDGLSDEQDEFGPCEVEVAPGAPGCRAGVRRCVNRAISCVPRTPAAAEVCGNGVDDECDGIIDDTAACMQSYAAVAPGAAMTLGSDDPNFGTGGDGPAHPVCLAAFAIDRQEVSNAAYAEFLNSIAASRVAINGYAPENPAASPALYILVDGQPAVALPAVLDGLAFVQSRGSGFRARDARFRDYPAVRVTWFGADAYCRWAGKHLPTEAEWWRAAFGEDGRRPYPWGDTAPDCTRANLGGGGPDDGACVCDLNAAVDPAAPRGAACTGAPMPVAALPEGNNPEGVANLFGNVNEWLHDWLDLGAQLQNNYYLSVPRDAWCARFPDGPVGPAAGQSIPRAPDGVQCVHCRMARGRHFYQSADLRVGARRWLDSDQTDATMGFRCSSGGAPR